jgi:hypothetical protein|tara:strand:- start:118 stop:405 length:288 start_codon:yes stop_codon:yes gene_type:complete
LLKVVEACSRPVKSSRGKQRTKLIGHFFWLQETGSTDRKSLRPSTFAAEIRNRVLRTVLASNRQAAWRVFIQLGAAGAALLEKDREGVLAAFAIR